jgi:two-component sensor histidine kinase
MLDRLEQGSLLSGYNDALSLVGLTMATTELWRGVIDVEFVVDELGACQPSELGLVDRIVNELVNNAHRHGMASHVRIELSLKLDTINLDARDNGVGLRNGAPGLGSALLAASTQGRWTRSTRQDSTGTIVHATLARTRTH